MRRIPTTIHGVLDYIVGLLLIASPWVFHFNHVGGAAVAVPIVLGVLAILYSLVTNYEMGVFRMLAVPIHLRMDVLSGIILAASPWIFGFSNQVYLPHLIIGLFEIVAGLTTEPSSRTVPTALGTDYARNEIHG